MSFTCFEDQECKGEKKKKEKKKRFFFPLKNNVFFRIYVDWGLGVLLHLQFNHMSASRSGLSQND